MPRREFPHAVKIAVIKRAGVTGMIVCEKCGDLAKRWQIDHIIADAHGGEPTLDNAMLICEACYAIKNPQDTTVAAKIKRQEGKHLGIRKPSTLQSPGFAKPDRQPKRLSPSKQMSLPSAIERRMGLRGDAK